MEPKQKGGHAKTIRETDQRELSAAGLGGPAQSGTPNEERTYAELEKFKAKRAQRERPGVKVELEV